MKLYGEKISFLSLFLTLKVMGEPLTIVPESPAYVRAGQKLNITITYQSSDRKGVFVFKYIDGKESEKIADAVLDFNSCTTYLNQSFSLTCFPSNSTLVLTLFTPVHNQIISCEALINGSTYYANTTIFVQVPVSDVILVPINTVEVDVNQDFAFSCTAQGCRPKANIIWYRDGNVVPENTSTLTPNMSLLDVNSTLITSFEEDEEGMIIYCSASIEGDMPKKSQEAKVDVKYAPSTDPELMLLSSVSVNEGDWIALNCSLHTLGDPNIIWRWMCGDDDLTLNASYYSTQSTLNITADRKYNQRSCQCWATSPRSSLSYNKSSGPQAFTVFYAPLFHPTMSTDMLFPVFERRLVILRCTLSTMANPPITWKWVCGDDDLTVNATNTTTESTLTFTADRKYHERKCQCWATSPRLSLTYNKSSEAKVITVYYPPSGNLSISSSSHSFIYLTGDSVNLTCTVFGGNPIANLSWECSSKDPNTVTRSNSTLAALVLFLKVDKTFNNKDCTCRSSHPLQNKNKTVTLIVQYESNITTPLKKTYIINETENFSLECTVDGNPLSNITWTFLKKNTVVNKTYNSNNCFIKIPSAKCLDHGKYQLVAKNGIGRSEKTTNIAVNCKPRLFTADSQTPDKIGIGNNESLIISVQLLLYPPSSKFEWEFTGNYNQSHVIENNTLGYKIASIISDNEQNITLFKQNVSDKEFGSYNLTIANSVGTFTKTYKVNGARSPLPPFNLTVVCDNPLSITWTADFNGGDKQTFHVFSSSGENYLSFKELTTVNDKGFGQIHSYTPSENLYGQFWFKISASNKFGNSTTDAIPCFIKTPDESPSNTAMLAGIAAGGGVCLAFVVIVVAVYFRKYHQSEIPAKHIERLNNVNENEEDGADVDGLKENSLYVSAGPRDDEKPEVAVYAAVVKKLPQSNNNSNLYADVKKSGRQDTNKGTMSAEVKPKKGLFKKDGKAKHKKGKKPKNRPGEADVYENSEDIAMSTNVDNVYSNAGQKGLNKQEERGYKNKDGLLYVEVNFDGKQGQDNPVIHGEDEKTDYATVEFPMPSALHKASGSEEL